MAVQVFCVIALAALAASAPVTTETPGAVLSYLLSWNTGLYLNVSASGEISANGTLGTFQY